MTKNQLREFIERYRSGQSHLKLLDDIMMEFMRMSPDVPDPPFDEIVALYHRYMPGSPKVLRVTDARRANIRQRWIERAEQRNIKFWESLFQRAARSDFLCGRKTDWVADFDFFLQPSSMTKLLEGRYDNRGGGTSVVIDYAAGIGEQQRRKQGGT